MPGDTLIVHGTLLLAGLLLMSAALGRSLLRLLAITLEGRLERGVIAVGLGLGAMQFIPFALFALGIGKPIVVRGTVLLLALALVPDMLAVLRVMWQWLRTKRKFYWWEIVIAGVFLVLLSLLYIMTLPATADDDALSYHLTSALRFLGEGRFIHLVSITPSNWPSCVEFLFAILVAIHPAATISIVQFALGGLTIATVYSYGKTLKGRLLAATAVTLLMASDKFLPQMARSLIDLGPTAFATLAVMSLHRSVLSETQSRKWETLAAIFAGLAATAKLQGIWVIFSLIVVILLDRQQGDVRSILKKAFRFGCIAVCVVAPWYIRTWVMTGNPFYPTFYSFFGGNEWTEYGWRRYVERFLMRDAPANFGMTPWSVYGSYAARVALVAFVAFLVVRYSAGSGYKIPARFAALFITCITAASSFNNRFFLPGFPSFVICLAGLTLRWKRYQPAVTCGAAIALAIWILPYLHLPDLAMASEVALGRVSQEEYLRSRLEEYDVVQFANNTLPPDAKILLGTIRQNTAMHRHQTYWSNLWEQDSFHYDSEEQLESDLRRLHITHLLLENDLLGPRTENHVLNKIVEIQAPALFALAERRGKRLFESRGISLYLLEWSPPQTTR